MMTRKTAAACAAVLGLLSTAFAASKPAPVSAQVTLRADQPGATIDANIYGQFMEHLGRTYAHEDSP